MADSLWILPFGKYKGQGIEDIPDSYLDWLTGMSWFKEKFPKERAIILKELKYRDDWEEYKMSCRYGSFSCER